MLSGDEVRIRHYIEQHRHYTNSDIAGRILDDWETWRTRFIKVMPVDYVRALTQLKQANTVKHQAEEVQRG